MNKGWGDYLDSFRFEDENEYEYETLVLKKETLESLLLFFSPKKLVRLFIVKEVKPFPDSKMINLLTFDNLFPPFSATATFSKKLEVERRRLFRFPAKMMLVHA